MVYVCPAKLDLIHTGLWNNIYTITILLWNQCLLEVYKTDKSRNVTEHPPKPSVNYKTHFWNRCLSLKHISHIGDFFLEQSSSVMSPCQRMLLVVYNTSSYASPVNGGAFRGLSSALEVDEGLLGWPCLICQFPVIRYGCRRSLQSSRLPGHCDGPNAPRILTLCWGHVKVRGGVRALAGRTQITGAAHFKTTICGGDNA